MFSWVETDDDDGKFLVGTRNMSLLVKDMEDLD